MSFRGVLPVNSNSNLTEHYSMNFIQVQLAKEKEALYTYIRNRELMRGGAENNNENDQ